MIPESRVDALYGRIYNECHSLASRHYQREETIATATHALFIEYNRNVKGKIEDYITMAKKGATVHPKDRQLAYNIYCGLFKELIDSHPSVRTALEEWVIKIGVIDFNEVLKKITDYMSRNGFEYELNMEHIVKEKKVNIEYPVMEWDAPSEFALGSYKIVKTAETGDGMQFYEGDADNLHIWIQFRKSAEKNIIKDVEITMNGKTDYFDCKSIIGIQSYLEQRFIEEPKKEE